MAAMDRLAAMRAQQGGNRYNSSNAPQQAGGYDRRNNPYAQQDEGRYEMTKVQDSRDRLTGTGDDMNSFYDEISSIQDAIREFDNNVRRVSDLHSRSLNNMDDQAAARNAQQLESLVDETSGMSNDIRNRIKALAQERSSPRDANARSQQIGVVKQKFMESIQNYRSVEQQFSAKYKQRMERQFKIVKPDATPEEVRAVVNDEQGGQVFSQALMSSNRYGESRAAYREVQERHEDIKRIERTITELAQLFNDMSVLVEQQDETINTLETTAGDVEKDVEGGLVYTEKAVVSARAARKKRWICFGIIVVILIIVAIILAIEIPPLINKNKNNSS